MNVMAWADRNLERFGDYTALVFCGRSWTSRALHDRSSRLATALLARGVAPGERVVLWLPNSADLVIAFTAVIRAGATAVVIGEGSTPAEVSTIGTFCSAVTLITLPALASRVN